MQRHPAKHELLSYAESLVSGRSISAQMAAHVSRCRPCWDEVQAMRLTLRAATVAAAIEPSREFTASLLLAAKNARGEEAKRQKRHRSAFAIIKGSGYAAALLLVSAAWFGAASQNSSSTTTPSVASTAVAAVQTAAMEAVAMPASNELQNQIQSFEAAVNARTGAPESLQAVQKRRLWTALDAQTKEAQAAWERNPGCRRAVEIVSTNQKRKAETLKELYLQQSL